MSKSAVDMAKERAALGALFAQLPDQEQALIELLSVIYEPINRKSLIHCMTDLGFRDSEGKPFRYETLRPLVNRLESQALLESVATRGLLCNRLIVEIATRHLILKGGFDRITEVVHEHLPVKQGWYGRTSNSREQLVRELRIGFYRGDSDYIQHQIQDWDKSYRQQAFSVEDVYRLIYENPFDPYWLLRLPADLFTAIIWDKLTTSYLGLKPASDYLSLLETYLNEADNATNEHADEEYALQELLVELSILNGALPQARRLLEGPLQKHYSVNTLAVRGWLAFLQGENETAIAHYTEALRFLRKSARNRRAYFNRPSGLFFILALLKTDDPARLQEALTHINMLSGHWLQPAYRSLKAIILMQQGRRNELELVLNASVVAAPTNSLVNLFSAVCIFWGDNEAANALTQPLIGFHRRAQKAGYGWLAAETAGLLSRLSNESHYAKEAMEFANVNGIQPLVDTIKPREPWELALNALLNLQKTSSQTTQVTSNQRRLVWFLRFYEITGTVHFEPREQKLTQHGHWSKGRSVSLKRLNEPEKLPYLSPQDIKICRYIDAYSYGYYGQTQYEFNARAVLEMVGHPQLFWADSPEVKVELVMGEPELRVTRQPNGKLLLNVFPEADSEKDFVVIKESLTRLKVYVITPDHQRIASILSGSGLAVPAAAEARVVDAITQMSTSITVHSDIGVGETDVQTMVSDPRPHVHLVPFGQGLKLSLLTQPFSSQGPYYRPGTGGETVIAEIRGQRLRTHRNLGEEKKLADAVTTVCSGLEATGQADGEWIVEAPESCLNLLLELQALDDQVVVEWPEGEKFKINYQATLRQLNIGVHRSKDWFWMDGKLELNQDLVLTMHQLLEWVQTAPGRFLPLGNGEFVALTHEFRKRLDELQAYSEKQANGVRFHPLAALALREFTDEVGELKADAHWKNHIKRLNSIRDFEPELPSTLQAELRDYQIDGFRWLAHLAHWGVGACLADDMGLGKTLQALALILTRAPHGPSLVVAPTSVGMNWTGEAQRFAPTLNAISFGNVNRDKTLADLKPFDMVVCSYGLLQQETVAEQLAGVNWQVIVLDEAQAIKNSLSKRSQAAMRLHGEFKLITTGTPIENHLGELWTLFRFINPGLLGSQEGFNKRFAIPIERDQNREARNHLKKLVQPFILRRTKNQVLEELPSRTEILLQVDLTEEERAFYEALRQRAVQHLNTLDTPAGQQHLQILAEIMKLRRACCNPRLVVAESQLPSSKLQVFAEVVTELLDNRHKALVFSQFVDHLKIIRDELDRRNIRYQYLDGATPAKERKIRVDAFQAGEGDIFLISLKAGGTGLNLTAADYVIHMDPWWNPAVEDQASDRAHRIGQQRPVTIYRLVARHTIEEKIVDLHRYKRELADGLLEGSDLSGRVSAVELLSLINDR